MAKISSSEQFLLEALKARVEAHNLRTIVWFKEGDIVRLNVSSKGLNSREKSPKGIAPYMEYSFELARGGRKFTIWTSLGAFLRLPLPKNGFSPEDIEDQRELVNNAIFSGFEMRPAGEILESLKKGVKCSKVYASTASSSRCYRWVTVWERWAYLVADPEKKPNGSSELTGRSQTNCPY